jgi:RNA polymerase sigma-70 factor (ECF subfamily)
MAVKKAMRTTFVPADPADPAGPDEDRCDLEHLFRMNFDRLVRMIAVITDEAADAVQDAFVEAYRHWDHVASYDDPLMWVRRVAVNKARDRIRRSGRERRLGVHSSTSGGTAATSSVIDRIDVRSAIRKLPVRQQLAVVLYYLGDLSVAQVAGAMDISEGAVKAALHAARKNLLPLLEANR